MCVVGGRRGGLCMRAHVTERVCVCVEGGGGG